MMAGVLPFRPGAVILKAHPCDLTQTNHKRSRFGRAPSQTKNEEAPCFHPVTKR